MKNDGLGFLVGFVCYGLACSVVDIYNVRKRNIKELPKTKKG
jgi:hypothetical protein